MRGTIDESENPEDMLSNAMASSVAAVSDSVEEIEFMFDMAKEKAVSRFMQMSGQAEDPMSPIDAQLSQLLSGGGEEMSIADEINMS